MPQFGTKCGTMCGALKKNYPNFSFSIDVSGGARGKKVDDFT